MPDSAPARPATKGTLLQGKRGLIMGVANERSLGWGIAAACAAQGAELAFTFQGEALERRVRPLAASVGSDRVFPCDVADEASIDAAFAALRQDWDGLDFLVHAIAYADKTYLRGRYLDTPRAAFLQALDISCYSFTAVAQRAVPMMRAGASVAQPDLYRRGALDAALQRHGRRQGGTGGVGCATWRPISAAQNIRVNAISAGPIKTLAAFGIGDFHYILRWNQLNAPMQRNVTIEEVGGAAVYLLSDLSAARDRRGAPCRLRLPYCRYEASRRARYRDRRGMNPEGANILD